jgi:hypothetical protein
MKEGLVIRSVSDEIVSIIDWDGKDIFANIGTVYGRSTAFGEAVMVKGVVASPYEGIRSVLLLIFKSKSD